MAGATPSSPPEPKKTGFWQGVGKNLNPIMGAVIGVVVLILFSYAIVQTVRQIGIAPAAADTATGTDGYSSFDRAVQVVGLVSPVLTIVLGFYFGARAGASDAQAATAEKESAQGDAERLKDVLALLRDSLKDDEMAQDAFRRVQRDHPDVFSRRPGTLG